MREKPRSMERFGMYKEERKILGEKGPSYTFRMVAQQISGSKDQRRFESVSRISDYILPPTPYSWNVLLKVGGERCRAEPTAKKNSVVRSTALSDTVFLFQLRFSLPAVSFAWATNCWRE